MNESTEIMYVIVPYFNFNNYQNNINNIGTFIENSKKYSSVKIVLIEGIHNEATKLEDYSDKIYKHIKVTVPDIIWVKENLINIAVSHLPEDWRYMSWVDRDIEFTNTDWAYEAIKKLKSCDLIQPWQGCQYIPHSYYFENKGYTAGTFSAMSLIKTNDLDKQKFPHSGHAWSISRNFYDKIGKLFDACIVGGADGLLHACIVQNRYHPHYQFMQKAFWDYMVKFRDIKIGFVSGNILHHFHGAIENRKYVERVNILLENNYCPERDLYYDENNVLRFSGANRLREAIIGYFASRME